MTALTDQGAGDQLASVGLPDAGQSPDDVRQALIDWQGQDRAQVADIRFSRRFWAGEDVAAVAAQAYGLFANTGRASPYPGLPSPASITAMTRDLVTAGLHLMHAGDGCGAGCGDGLITSGGTESAILATRAACARKTASGELPQEGSLEGPLEIIAPWSAHPCIDKAADLMGLRLIRVPLGADLVADPAAMEAAITPRTAMIYASFPSYPFGLCDDVAALAKLARKHGIWLHVDASMGGFLAPFLKAGGTPVPDFDFSVPGVCSIAMDLHKHGYGAKGAGLLLFRDGAHVEDAGFCYGDFPLPPMITRSLAGTSAGAPIAAAWAVFRYLGVAGYRRLADDLARVRDGLSAAIRSVDGFDVPGDPLFSVLAVTSQIHDMTRVYEALSARGWFFLPTHNPLGLQVNFSVCDGPLAPQLAEALTRIGAGDR